MSTLLELIPLLEAMPHDDLRDWIDYVDYYHLTEWLTDENERDSHRYRVRSRRIGLHTGSFPDPIFPPKVILTLRTEIQQAAETLFEDLDEPNQKAVLAIAHSQRRIKAPIRRTSTGNIQVKLIPYQRVVKDTATGKPLKDNSGSSVTVTYMETYLYLRYWQVHGDAKRNKKRVKSIYIGGEASLSERISPRYTYPYRVLADYFRRLLREHGVERTRTDKKTGEIMTYHMRPDDNNNPIAEYEARILACIDMSRVDEIGSDAIDHECLQVLQAELPLE